MKQFWRIYQEINKDLNMRSRPTYLEVGAGDGKNIRLVRARRKYAVADKLIPRDWLLYQWLMKTEDFLNMIRPEDQEQYAVIFLRDWTDKSLEHSIRKLHRMLLPDGVLYVENLDVNGRRNSAWRFAVGLRRAGIPVAYINGKYLAIYKPDEEIKGSIRSRMKLENYLKIKDSFEL